MASIGLGIYKSHFHHCNSVQILYGHIINVFRLGDILRNFLLLHLIHSIHINVHRRRNIYMSENVLNYFQVNSRFTKTGSEGMYFSFEFLSRVCGKELLTQYEANKRAKKAPSNRTKTHGYYYLIVSIRLRTVLGSFSALSGPAPLARLKVDFIIWFY